MNCDKFQELLADYFTGQLAADEKDAFTKHMAQCPDCQSEFQAMSATLSSLDAMQEEEPSPRLRRRFYAFLEKEKRGAAETFWVLFDRWLQSWWPKTPRLQLGLGLAFLLIAFFSGQQMHRWQNNQQELTHLRQEVHQMRQMVTLSLLNQPSATDRLKAVNISSTISQPDDGLVTALSQTLIQDSHVNVRLAALDALVTLKGVPVIRDTLIMALNQDTSPLLQISIIDYLVSSHDRSSRQYLEALTQNPDISPVVQQRAQWGLDQI